MSISEQKKTLAEKQSGEVANALPPLVFTLPLAYQGDPLANLRRSKEPRYIDNDSNNMKGLKYKNLMRIIRTTNQMRKMDIMATGDRTEADLTIVEIIIAGIKTAIGIVLTIKIKTAKTNVIARIITNPRPEKMI